VRRAGQGEGGVIVAAMARLVGARCGVVGKAALAGQGSVLQRSHGLAWRGQARRGMAGQRSHGEARRGQARRGLAGRGGARQVGHGKFSQRSRGGAWRGWARQGNTGTQPMLAQEHDFGGTVAKQAPTSSARSHVVLLAIRV
jgi:hypothetical protein